MRLASFVISFCLHAGFVLLVLFWPSPPLRQQGPQAMTVSLVEGLPGGDRTPSPILGPAPSAPEQKQPPPLPPAPPQEPPQPVATVPPPEAIPIPTQETPPPRLEAPEPIPKPPPPPPDTVLLADKKAEEPKKQPEPKKPPPPKAETKKPDKPPPPKRDPAAEALAKLRADAKSGGSKAVNQALAVARQKSGGGGGEGEGEGGGGIGDVYGAQIVMAVQPNWHWPALAQGNLSVTLYLRVDVTGLVLDVRVETSSGNPLFDSSAVAAVRRTHTLPPPPSPAFREIVLPFFPMR